MEVPPEEISRYGCAGSPSRPPRDRRLVAIRDIVEKPPAGGGALEPGGHRPLRLHARDLRAPRAVSAGRGRRDPAHRRHRAAARARGRVRPPSSGRFDTGNKLDYLKATVELALRRPDLAPDFGPWLREDIRAADPAGARCRHPSRRLAGVLVPLEEARAHVLGVRGRPARPELVDAAAVGRVAADTVVAPRPCRLRQLRHGRLRRPCRRHRRHGRRPVLLREAARTLAGQRRGAARRRRGGPHHDRRAPARRRRRGRAGRGDTVEGDDVLRVRSRCRPGATCDRSATTSTPATSSRAGAVVSPAPPRRAGDCRRRRGRGRTAGPGSACCRPATSWWPAPVRCSPGRSATRTGRCCSPSSSRRRRRARRPRARPDDAEAITEAVLSGVTLVRRRALSAAGCRWATSTWSRRCSTRRRHAVDAGRHQAGQAVRVRARRRRARSSGCPATRCRRSSASSCSPAPPSAGWPVIPTAGSTARARPPSPAMDCHGIPTARCTSCGWSPTSGQRAARGPLRRRPGLAPAVRPRVGERPRHPARRRRRRPRRRRRRPADRRAVVTTRPARRRSSTPSPGSTATCASR